MTAGAVSGPPAAGATGTAVWERVWRHLPSDAKDDAALARERRSPRWRTIVARLKATFGAIDGLKTVELGSGRGDLSVLLAREGARVTLIDYSDVALELAGRRFKRLGLDARFARADMLGEMGAWRDAFDVSASYGVIEHFKGRDRTRVVRAHHDVIRPGGLAVISVPNAWCVPYRLWKAYLEFRGWWPYGMEIPYSRGELLDRARRAGFARSRLDCTGLWQSIGDQWGRSVLGRGPDWVDKPSRWDPVMGFNLVLFGWRDG